MQPLERALEIAFEAHSGQTDKAGEMYILHPLRVMLDQDSEEAKIAAALHDVVEDSEWTVSDLREEHVGFPEEAIDAVELLTQGEESYDKFIEATSTHYVARSVKIADIEDNMDLRRLESVDCDTFERIEKYHRSWHRLKRSESGR